MAIHRIPAGGASRPAGGRLAPSTTGWTVAGAAFCATALLFTLILPGPLVLLAAGSAVATAGFAVAAVLFLSGRRIGHDGTVGWDLASALVFLGFAAGVLANAGEALTTFTELRAR